MTPDNRFFRFTFTPGEMLVRVPSAERAMQIDAAIHQWSAYFRGGGDRPEKLVHWLDIYLVRPLTIPDPYSGVRCNVFQGDIEDKIRELGGTILGRANQDGVMEVFEVNQPAVREDTAPDAQRNPPVLD